MKIAIVGLGVVGGSIAMGLLDKELYDVYGVDSCAETVKKAEEMGIILRGNTDPSHILPLADLTIICIYPAEVPVFVKENLAYFRKDSVVMDVTGIKMKMIEEILPVIDDHIDFVFAHPMAGREKKGIDYASEKVNHGANFLITPTDRNKKESLEMVERVAKDIGFGRISHIAPEAHDEMIAYTSQLTHIIAVALMNSDNGSRDTGAFIGDSFRDITRISAINETLWSDLFLGNKKYLIEKIDAFEAEMKKIREMLAADDKAALEQEFIKSTRRRESL